MPAEVSAAKSTTTGNGALKKSATPATRTPIDLASKTMPFSFPTVCTATKAASSAVGRCRANF